MLLYILSIIIAFFIGKKIARLGYNSEIVILVRAMIAVDKRLSLYGKNISNLSINDVLFELNKQLKLELHDKL